MIKGKRSQVKIVKLSKHFPNIKAVNKVSLTLERGIYGLVGPNGAGKTTLIKLICGLIHPTKGLITIAGHKPGSPKANARIGYMSENMGYYEDRTPMQYLRYFSDIYGIDEKIAEKRIVMLLKKVNLYDRRHDPISTYSRGMKQRIGIIRAMLHNPKLVLLDEPLSGMDPTGRKEIIKALEALKDEGSIIMVSSHELKDMDTLCDNICVMRKGKIIVQGPIKELISKELDAKEILSFNLHTPSAVVKDLPNEIDDIIEFEIEDDKIELIIDHDPDLERRILRWLLDKNIDFSYKKHLIDTIYTHLISDEEKKEA